MIRFVSVPDFSKFIASVRFGNMFFSVRRSSACVFRTRRGSVRFGSFFFRVRFRPVPELTSSVRFGSVNVQLPCLQKDMRTGSISRDIVNFRSELCRRRSGIFTDVAFGAAWLSGDPFPYNSAAETALQPLMFCSESLSSPGHHFPEECFVHRPVSVPRTGGRSRGGCEQGAFLCMFEEHMVCCMAGSC